VAAGKVLKVKGPSSAVTGAARARYPKPSQTSLRLDGSLRVEVKPNRVTNISESQAYRRIGASPRVRPPLAQLWGLFQNLMDRLEVEFTMIPQARLVSLPPRPVSVTRPRIMFNMCQGLPTGTAWAM
jgi:hypothetical protein